MGVGLHVEEIKARLRIVYGSVRAFEREWGLPETSVKDLLRGRGNKHVEAAVLRFLKEASGGAA